MLSSRRRRRVPAAVLLAGVLCSLTSCGARTELYGRELCGREGQIESCFDVCGQGTRLCEGGYWQDCRVETTERACSNDCGSGSQSCSGGVWQTCDVPIATRDCSTPCGAGTQQCESGAWLECAVQPVSEDCANDCGSGVRTCADGAWGDCDVPVSSRECESVCGKGQETCIGGAWQPCDAPEPNPPQLKSTIRDFDDTHPDFEIMVQGGGADIGIVAFDLGPDDKPVYNGNPTTRTTTGKDNFDQWYRDVPGVNLSQPLDLQLSAEPGDPVFFVYDNHSFFPIDGQLLGNQERSHNFHFTLEAQTSFTYIGGEEFTFSGDDDMWVFINRRLAIDLGGLHNSLTDSVALDEDAGLLQIAKGETYPTHFFFAERHTVASNFTIRTTVAEAGSCE